MPMRDAVRRATVIAFAVIALAGLWLPTASGQEPASGIKLQARLELGGYLRPGAASAVSISVESPRLFAGTLRVSVGRSEDGAPVQIERAIEVAGGSKKIVRLVVPPSGSVRVAVVDRRKKVLASSDAVSIALTAELVGVLAPGLTPPARITLPTAERTAEVVAVPQEMLDLGPSGLGQLTHLMADAAITSRLSERRRSAILGWTSLGGELIIAAAKESDVAWLPSQWRGAPAAFRRNSVGDGTVTIVSTPASDAAWAVDGPLWRRVVRPIARSSSDGNRLGQGWIEAMASTGAFNRSRLGWLLAFVLVYAGVCGPLNFVVLSKLRRRELAWVTVPVLAVVFAAGAFLIGRGIRTGPVLQGTGVVVLDEGGTRATVAVGAISRNGGKERVTVPGDWLIRPVDAAGFFGGRGLIFDDQGNQVVDDQGNQVVQQGDAGGSRVTLSGDKAVVQFDLAVGGIGTLAASSVVPGSNPNAGTLARRAGGEFAGRVTNPTLFAMKDARVFLPNGSTSVGNLGAGERSSEITVNQSAQNEFQPEFFDGNFEGNFEGGFDPRNPGMSQAIVQRARSVAGLGENGRGYLAGMVDLRQIGSAIGLSRVKGRVLVLVPLALSSKVLESSAVRRTVIATNGSVGQGGEGPFHRAILGANTATIRFELPAGARPKKLAFDIPVSRFGGPAELFAPGSLTLSIFDSRTGRWGNTVATAGDGHVDIDPALVSADGELVVRMNWKAQSKIIAIPTLSEGGS